MDITREDFNSVVALFTGQAHSFLDYALGIIVALIILITILSAIVSIVLAIKYIKFNKMENSAKMTGEEVARRILDENGLQKIKVKATGSLIFGNSYSHYFKKVRLRRLTRHKTSLTSIGMGAEKACLALLDKEGDKDMKRRIRLIPIINFGPFMFIPLLLAGIILDILLSKSVGTYTVLCSIFGLLLFLWSFCLACSVLVTEKKAQARACKLLREKNLATDLEVAYLEDLYSLYNVEYVNDTILSFLQLIFYILKIIIKAKASSNSN